MLHGRYVALVTPAAQMVVAMSNIPLSTMVPKVLESIAVDPALIVAGSTAPELPVLARPQQLGVR